MLDRLRIRGKLAVLVVIPLLSMVALAVPVVVDRVSEARRAADTAEAVDVAGQVGTLVQDLQKERLLSLGYLLDPEGGLVSRSDLIQQSTTVTDRVADLKADLGPALSTPVVEALANVQTLNELRAGILSGRATTDQIMATFGAIDLALIDSLRLTDRIDTGTSAGRQTLALDAVLRTDEAISHGAALLVLVVATKDADPRALQQVTTAYVGAMLVLQNTVARFTALATAEQNALYTLVSEAAAARIPPELVVNLTGDPTAALADREVQTTFPGVVSLITIGQFVQKKLVTDITAAVADQQRQALVTAYGVVGLVLLVLLVVVLLSLTVARTVARPLTRLTHSADRVARVAEAELVRIADDETESARPIRLDPVDVSGRDEIGDLARAFDRVQGTAARLVERQAASRRNVAQMFGHVGRRTQNLVGRQIALIDRLEQQETEPSRLQHLYRLDHISSRLRRNASSLVVLSGSAGGDGHVAPMPLGDVVRLALGEIEDYTRVDVQIRVDVMVTPGVIGDLVLALAELMENGTAFSPPHTRVTVSAELIPGGARVSLIDHGIGMPAERMAEENARLTRRERLDLTPTEVLGLFVVGRLARRHGWRVALSPTPGGGVTVELDIDDRLLVVRRAGTPATGVARAGAAPAVAGRAVAAAPEPGRAPMAGLGAELLATTAGPPPVPAPAAPAPAAPTSPAPVHGGPVPAMPARASAPPAVDGPAGPGEPEPRTTGRDQPAPAPESIDPVFNPVLLSRATQSLESGQPWDAFGTRPGEQARSGRNRTTESAAQSGASLRQRVPGAQLPQTPRPNRAVDSTPADPAAVRALLEEFEAGVQRAQRQYGASSPTPPAAPSRAAVPPAAVSPGAVPPAAAPPAAVPAPAPAPGPVPGPGAGQLNRRVPGANLSVPTPTARPNHSPARTRPADPDEVRDLITQFETGVARALTEVSPDHRHEEGRSQ
ncbi:nitrate- and nitrite sensing domain-containing protein [Solwaraspora sp. WMMD1047]|uniref:sensor histidine kinase n=1 Tax=Solwaraspora sp. WMMD1047 TaxID=3016102 RepID=UPI002415C20F|nr:nitrate- and nitrite sensing domain-containing protein [Solwaraspora sp. WMMD1047]MDG4833706.1 nitrate- and nitrite sensing domain-containing protein [Solwaraspora sp. WMMD1047]